MSSPVGVPLSWKKGKLALTVVRSVGVVVGLLGAAASATSSTSVSGKPDDLLGLCHWYKADSIAGLEHGDAVTQWKDSGPRKIHLDRHSGKPVFVASAINQLPAVRFKEGRAPGKGMFNQRLIAHQLPGDPKHDPPDGLQASRAVKVLTGDPNFTVFLVARIARSKEESVQPLGWGHGGWGIGKVEAGGGLFLELKADRLDVGAGKGQGLTTPDGSYAPYFGQPAIIMCAKAAGPLSSTTQVALNGVPAAVTGSDLVPNVEGTPLNVGGYEERALVFTKRQYTSPAMDVAEIIMYSRVLSPDEQNRVGRYLQEKYGIDARFSAVSMPSAVQLTVGVEPPELDAVVGFTGTGREAQGATVDLVAPEKVLLRGDGSPKSFAFDHWQGGVTEPSSRETAVRMDASKTLTAVYKERGAVFYVSLVGRDDVGENGWSGTLPEPNAAGTDGPFATLTRARDAIRQLKSRFEGTVPFPIQVLVGGGKYFFDAPVVFTAQDSGSQDFPVRYAAYPGETPVISGGRIVSGWQPYKDNILQCSVDGAGGGKLKLRQLFYNGRSQIRARTPNFDPDDPYKGGWATMEGPAEPESQTDFIYKPGTFPRRWAKPTEAEVNVFMGYGWANNIIPIQSIDEQTRVVTLEHSTKRFMKPQIDYDFPTPLNPNQRFRVENVLEELDQPGEWCWDSGEGKVYFWPPDGGIETSEVTIPVLDGLMALRGASHIAIAGMTFTETGSGDNFHHHQMEGVGAMFAMPDWKYCGEALLLDGAEQCRVEKNRFLNIGGNAVYVTGPSARNVIDRNEILQIGACGVCLVGVADKDRYPVFNEVVNNRIYQTGRLDMYSAGVFLGLSEGNVIGHNSIRHVPHHAINLGSSGWSRNLIEFNDIRDTCLETKDAGAINCWMEEKKKSVPRQGHIIRYNLIVDSRERGIYLDNYTANCSVYGNIIVRSGFWGIMVNTGKNNVIENNVFVGTKFAFGVGNWMDGLIPGMDGFTSGNRFCRNIITGGTDGVIVGEFHGERANVTVHGFSAVPEGEGKTPRALAQSDFNLVFDTPGAQAHLAEQRRAGFDIHSVIADPLFVDLQNGDYRLRPESPAFDLGFQAIDVRRIGPQEE
jgi:parallel beta-helix repeat protein